MKQLKLRPPLPENHKHLKRLSDSFNFQCRMTNLTTSNDINKSTKCLILITLIHLHSLLSFLTIHQ